MKTWIIGNAEGSIGEATEQLLRSKDMHHTVYGTGTEVDVRKPHQLADFVMDEGPFDNTVYCAGIASLQWIDQLLGENIGTLEYENVFAVNVFGFLNVLNIMTRTHSDGGNIVALVSDSSHVAMRGSIAYCSSKAALHQAVRVAARELAPKWRVNGVSPSIVNGTRMTKFIDRTVPEFRGWDAEQAKQYELSGIPLGRRASKMEVARVISSVMMGPEFMTGTIVEMTGGK